MQLVKILAAVAGLAAHALAQDGYDEPIGTTNQCITPRACFVNTTDTSVTYCVTTGWLLTYPGILRSHLQSTGYSSVNYNAPGFDKCGWNFGESVTKLAVSRGSIYYQSTNASLDFRPTDLIPRIQGALTVLQNSYPGLEIGLIVGFSFLFASFMFLPALWIAFFKFISDMCHCRCFRARKPSPTVRPYRQPKPSSSSTTPWPATMRHGLPVNSPAPPAYDYALGNDNKV